MSEAQDQTLKLQARICQLEQQTAQLTAERDGAVEITTCVRRQHTAAQRRRDVLQGERDAAAGECDQLRAQVTRLRGAIVAIMDGLACEYDVILSETPAQSVAHIEAAALRWYVDARIARINLSKNRSYALAHYTIDLRDLLIEANRIEQAAKS